MKNYLISILGAILIASLRFFDEASILSVFLVIAGLSALLYGIRHVLNKKEYLFTALLFILVYEVRFYDYTESHYLDILLGIGIGLIMFLIMAFERLFKKKEKSIAYILIYPVTYLLFLYFTEIVKINMPFRLDTYFSCIPVLCSITSLLGTYILDFLLALTASILVYIIDNKNAKEVKIISVIYIILMILIFGYGIIHLNKMNELESLKKDSVRIACATGPDNYTYANSLDNTTIDESIEILTKTVEKAVNEKAEILFYCEEAFGIYDYQEETLLSAAQSLAKVNNIHLLLTYEKSDSDNDLNGKGENKLCFISKDGEILYQYTKHCIIPFIETADYVKGDKEIESFKIEVHGKQLNIATAICYDTDYDSFMSSMSKDTDLLLVPTWDWEVIQEEHFSISCLRAISNKVTLVRSTYDGYNAVINSTGKALDKDETNTEEETNLFVYDAPIK